MHITDEEIEASHPVITGRHELYDEAMRLVGARHAKGDLVDLVTCLLTRIEKAEARVVELESRPSATPSVSEETNAVSNEREARATPQETSDESGRPRGSDVRGNRVSHRGPVDVGGRASAVACPSEAPSGTACDRCGARDTTLKNESTFLFCWDRAGCAARKAQRTNEAIHVPKTGEQTFWYEAGLEAGLARPCACEGVLRSETPSVRDQFQALVDFVRADQCPAKDDCVCCRAYLDVANAHARNVGLPDGRACFNCDGDGVIGRDLARCKRCNGGGRLGVPTGGEGDRG
jgi:hypothetical protein